MKKIEVVGWTNYDNCDYPADGCRTKGIFDAIVEEIREHGYNFSGYEHQEGMSGTPVLNNGYRICCRQREWGAIMAYAHEPDNTDQFAYVQYTFRVYGDDYDMIIPPEYVDEERIVYFEIPDDCDE